MKAWQVFTGEENKHGFQQYDLKATFLSKEKAELLAKDLVDKTPLYGDTLKEHDWSKDGRYKSWSSVGWTIVTICMISEIEIIE